MNALSETLSIWNTIFLQTCWNFTDLRSLDMDGRLIYFSSWFDVFFVFENYKRKLSPMTGG